MLKRTIGLFASVALLGSGVALAHGDQHQKSKQTQSSQPSSAPSTGGAGLEAQGSPKMVQMHGQQGQVLGDKEIIGTVVKSSRSELKLRTDTGIISMKVNKDTQFQDVNLKRAADLKEGQQVRTSFSVEKDTNIARSISLDTSMGGSGLDSDTGLHQDMGDKGLDQGLDPNQGGSGLNQGLDNQGLGDVTGNEGKTY